MARVLIIGLGYVGSALGLNLAAAGHEVYGTRRSPVALPGVEVVPLHLDDPSTLSALPDGTDAVFFTAAPDDSTDTAYRTVYVEGLQAVAERVGANVPLFFTSSTSVYGQSDGSTVDEASETRPSSFRGEVMLEAEAIATTALRLAGLYGPSRTRTLAKLRAGSAVADPARFLNFIHRDDAAGALAHLMTLGTPERIYIGVDHEPVRGSDFYSWLAAEAGTSEPVWQERDGTNKRLSSRKLRESGFEFRYPTFRDGFRALLQREPISPCPSSPNCVSTVDVDPRKRMPALGFRGDPALAVAAVTEEIREMGGEIVRVDGGRVEATFTSRLFRFVDDVLIVVEPDRERVDFRSASRTGYSDLGVNRRRMESLSERLTRRPAFFLLDDGSTGS